MGSKHAYTHLGWRGSCESRKIDILVVLDLCWRRAPLGKEKEDGSKAPVIRPYTPENLGDQKGFLDLVSSFCQRWVKPHPCSFHTSSLHCEINHLYSLTHRIPPVLFTPQVEGTNIQDVPAQKWRAVCNRL